LQRINNIEAQLQRLTNASERLEFKLQNVIEDGTSRIGDLEFRLVELEGGDVSGLSETTTLGGNADVTEAEIIETKPVELAVGEEADFDTAQKALEEKRYEDAAEMFNRFGKTYPTSPLAAQAFLLRGKALEANEDIKGSARAYLESFTNYQNSTVAPEALTLLGKALVKLGRIEAGCQTLSQVEIRFPQTSFAEDAYQAMQSLECL
ncbi:MAG: tol-pal system protein YbgF, partial [Paracoccaceae bacterium]